MKPFKAIAAMSLNRVIGKGQAIPWHLPEDFQWFKKMTTGQIIVMGRKTYESMGRPLPNRTTLVLSRNASLQIPGVQVIAELDQAARAGETQEVFVCGGAQIYERALPFCSDLYLTLVKRVVEGDTYFPPFEDRFALKEVLADGAEFKILHYTRRTGDGATGATPSRPEI